MSTDRPIKVLLVDDEVLVRRLLRGIIDQASHGEIEVVGEAGTGEEAIKSLDLVRPDVVLMDLQMPGMGGIEATKIIRSRPHPPEVVILTGLDRDDYSLQAGEAGAGGYLLKTEANDVFINGIKAVANGDGVLSGRIAKHMMRNISSVRGSSDMKEAVRKYSLLTERERDVADLVATGATTKDIARDLHMGETTVKTHMVAIQQKYGERSRVVIGIITAFAHESLKNRTS